MQKIIKNSQRINEKFQIIFNQGIFCFQDSKAWYFMTAIMPLSIRKGILLALLLLSLGINSMQGLVPAQAVTSSDLQKKYDQNRQDADDYEKIAEKLAVQIKKLNKQISGVEKEIEKTQDEMETLDAKITVNEAQLLEVVKKRDAQKANLYGCIRLMYEGRYSLDWLSILLHSVSIVDYLGQQIYVQDLNTYYDNILAEYETVAADIQNRENELITLRDQREDELDEYQWQQEEFDTKVANLSQKMRKAEQKAQDADKLADALSKKIEAMKEAERAALEKNTYDGSNSGKVIYSGNGTDYYYVKPYPYTETELSLMAAIIEAEAGSTYYPGLIAVGSVVMNRVQDSKFDDTIAGVIYAPYQFEPARSGRLAAILAKGPADTCMKAAKEVLDGKRNVHNFYFKAAWYAQKHGIHGVQIGGNVFH